MPHILRDGGWPAMLAVLIGVFALLTCGIAALCLAFSRRAAFFTGLAGLALSSLASIVGALGVAYGHWSLERAMGGGFLDNAAMVERIVRMGYREAAGCGIVGFAVAILPILLGGVAVLVGAGPGKRAVAAVAVACAAAAALVALAASFSKPPKGTYALALDDEQGWDVAEARAEIDVPGKHDQGCGQLDEALASLALPRRTDEAPTFSRDPDSIAPGTRAAATACARDVFDRLKKGETVTRYRRLDVASSWSKESLLESPLLVDDRLRRDVAAYETDR